MPAPAPTELVKSHGGRYATELGIDLVRVTKTDDTAAASGEYFKWFLAAVLYGTRIPAGLASRTWREFAARGVLTPDRIVKTGWDGLVAMLDAGGYVRYDYKTASKLLAVCTALLHDYGDLASLHAAAADPRDLERRLKALGKGIGDTTVAIFLRELRGIWARADPSLSPLALTAAQALGYLHDVNAADQALARLQQVWIKAGQAAIDFADFETALVREGLRMRRIAARTKKSTRP